MRNAARSAEEERERNRKAGKKHVPVAGINSDIGFIVLFLSFYMRLNPEKTGFRGRIRVAQALLPASLSSWRLISCCSALLSR